MRRYDSIDVLLHDDDGEETEAEVRVYFTVQPREPDVGIMNAYAEVSHVAMLGLGFIAELLIELPEHHEGDVHEWCDIAIYEEGIG